MAWTSNVISRGTITGDSGGILVGTPVTYTGDVVFEMELTFNGDCDVTFYSTGDVDTLGYYSADESYDTSTGVPTNVIGSDDDGGDGQNFSLTFHAAQGSVYYLWTKNYGSSTGDSTLYVSISNYSESGSSGSWTDNYTNLGYLDEDYTERVAVGGTEYLVYRARFYDSGEVGFYSAGTSTSPDVTGYITLQDNAYNTSTGEISNYIVGGSSHGNISLSFNASSDTYYYFWIRVTDPSESGYVRFTIEIPGGSTPAGDWEMDDWGGSRVVNAGSTLTFYRGEPAYYTLSCIPLHFGTSGSYTISASTSIPLYGYLSTSQSYDSSYGEPTGGVIGSDTSSSGGFSFDVTVSTATQYYLWVRTSDGSAGDSSFTVEFAEGSGGDTWLLSTGSFGNVTSLSQNLMALGPGYIYRYTVTFSASGTAKFYSTGSYYTTGYVSSSYSGFDEYTGIPDSYDAWDEGSGIDDNFSISFNVSANTTYYFWFRMHSYSESGSVYIDIEPPSGGGDEWRLDDFAYGTVSSRINEGVRLSSKYLALRTMSFAASGTVTVYTTGDYDTVGYQSNSSAWNQTTGAPSNPTQYADGGGSGDNFRFTFTAAANTTYYLWFRISDGSAATNTFYFVVEPPGTATWDLKSYDLGTISSTYTKSDTLIERTMWRFAFSPQSTGTYAMYTTGSLDTHGYLSTSAVFDNTNGVPTYYITDNDDAGSGNANCKIVYNLTAGTTYYFWVRPKSDSGQGQTTVIIEPPAGPTNVGWWVYTNSGWKKATCWIYTNSGWVQTKPFIRASSAWVEGT